MGGCFFFKSAVLKSFGNAILASMRVPESPQRVSDHDEQFPLAEPQGLADAYEAAKRAALARLARGSHLGGGRLPSREELHDRFSRWLSLGLLEAENPSPRFRSDDELWLTDGLAGGAIRPR